jgi:predicted RNA binding protein with dsRBD fold (UPF0201 family)
MNVLSNIGVIIEENEPIEEMMPKLSPLTREGNNSQTYI